MEDKLSLNPRFSHFLLQYLGQYLQHFSLTVLILKIVTFTSFLELLWSFNEIYVKNLEQLGHILSVPKTLVSFQPSHIFSSVF